MMNIAVFFVISTVVVGSSLAANLTVASPLEEYIALANKKNQDEIKAASLRIECVKSRGADAIKVIKDQQEETLIEIQRYEDSLVPLEALSLIRKHCVQKYKKLLISLKSTSKSFLNCITKAQTRLDSLTVNAKTYQNSAEVAVDVNIPNAIASCNKSIKNNPVKLEECVVNNVTSYTNTIDGYLRDLDKSLDASLCASTDLSRDAIKCSFKIEREVLVTIGKVTNLIDNCVSQTETVCPCAKDLMVEGETPMSVRRLLTEYGTKNGTKTITPLEN